VVARCRLGLSDYQSAELDRGFAGTFDPAVVCRKAGSLRRVVDDREADVTTPGEV
jgi:hypothetical protein